MRPNVLLLPLFALCLPLSLAARPHAATRTLVDHVQADMDFLASDTLQGRGSATRDEHLAAQYCAAVFEGLGLKPAGDTGTFLQRVPVDLSHASARRQQAMAVFVDTPRTETWNAVAILPGTDAALTNQVILLTAHLDHLGMRKEPAKDAANNDVIYNGADDDASGTTAVLNLARMLAAGKRPKRTVVFALFGSEELGGYGNHGFLAHPPVPLTSIVANLEFEMIGRPDAAIASNALWLTGFERSTLGAELAKHGAHLVADPHPAEKFFTRSDNYALAKQGIIAHTVSSFGLHKDYHQVSDELRTIDFSHMDSAIASMEKPVRWLANTDWKPQWTATGKP